MTETEPESLDTMNSDILRWKRCVAGCIVREGQAVISLSCFHSICSDKCLAKMKGDSLGEKLFCGVCKVEVLPEDLQRRITPSEVFSKNSKPEDIVRFCGHCIFELPAVAHCADCNYGLCKFCTEKHPLFKRTYRHKIEEYSKEEQKKQIEVLQKCRNHWDINKSHHCYTCCMTMCELCVVEHAEAGHKFSDFEESPKIIKPKAKVEMKVPETSECVNLDVLETKKEVNQKERKKVNGRLKLEISMLSKSLSTHDSPLEKEVKSEFLKKFHEIFEKSEPIEKGTKMCSNILKVWEEIANSRDKDALVKFVDHFSPILDYLTILNKKFEQDGDTSVKKDCNFKVDTGLDVQSRNDSEGWGNIDCKYEPKEVAAAPTKTCSGVGKLSNDSESSSQKLLPPRDNDTPSKSPGILNTNNLERPSKLQARWFGVNATGVSQLSINKLNKSLGEAHRLGILEPKYQVTENDSRCQRSAKQ